MAELTGFEREVAEALSDVLETNRLQFLSGSRRGVEAIPELLAPHVAAALDRTREAVADAFKDAVIAEHEGRPLSDPVERREWVRREALVALRAKR